MFWHLVDNVGERDCFGTQLILWGSEGVLALS